MEFVKPLSRHAIAALLVAVILALLGLLQFGNHVTGFLGSIAPGLRPPVADPGSIVLQIRNATDLTTAIYAAETIVPASQSRELGRLKLGETKLLYIAKGEVRAGVDLSQITTDNLDIESGTIHLLLPAPRIIDRKIDVDQSSIYDVRQGWFGPRGTEHLHILAEQRALQKIVVAACEHGLLEDAGEQAKAVVVQLLSKAGYDQVQVETRHSDANACPQTTASTLS